MKRIAAVVLSIVTLLAFAIPVYADDGETKHPTGLIVSTWDDIVNDMDDSLAEGYCTYRLGDVNGDGKITAADARLCLRVSAGLESILSLTHSDAADIDLNGKLTASDARSILRISAKLDPTPATVAETSPEWGCIIGPFASNTASGYTWKCLTKSDSVSEHIKIQEFKTKSEDGLTEKQYFILTPDSYGRYQLYIELTNAETGEVSEAVTALVCQNGTISAEVGSQVVISGLYSSGSTKYRWKCTAEPESGLKIDHTTKENPRYDENGEPYIGTPVENIFTITPEQEGKYRLHFELAAVDTGEAIDEFFVLVTA